MKKVVSLFVAVSMLMMICSSLGMIGAANAAGIPVPAGADANSRYATPGGAGSKDGTSWENAFEGAKEGGLKAAWSNVPENGTLFVASGDYGKQSVSEAKGGKSLTEMKKLIGVDTGAGKPVMTAGFAFGAPGNDKFFDVNKGANFIWIENFKLRNYFVGVRVNGNSTGLRFYNIDLENSSDMFYIEGGAKANADHRVTDIIIDGCTATNFMKSMVRIRYGVSDVIISNCVADAGGKEVWHKDNFPMAFQVTGDIKEAPDQRITYVDCIAKNSYHEGDSGSYWNADGFNSERVARDLTYIRCYSYNATDGGWDVKSDNPTLIDCVAMANKRNYRMWSRQAAVLINCIGAYSATKGGSGAGCGVGVFGGPKGTTSLDGIGVIKAYNCTFYNNKSTQLLMEGGRIELYDCIVGTDVEGQVLYNSNSNYQNNSYALYNTAVYQKGKEGVDPQFKNASDKWFDGKSDDWNSLLYKGAIGYHYDAAKQPATSPESTADYSIRDMAGYEWAKESVDFVVEKGFMNARSQSFFSPAYNINRAEFASMLVRTLGFASDAQESFTDVPSDYPYAGDITVAKAVGITNGLGDGTFSPYDAISREQVMTMLSRALVLAKKLPESYLAPVSGLDKFIDKADISEYALQHIANMVEKEIVKGGTNNDINPQGNTTRAEAAVLAKRVFDME